MRAVLDAHGFEVSHAGVRLKDDPLFATGAVYRRRSITAGTSDAFDQFDRLVKALTPVEAQGALRALLLNFPELRAEAARSRKAISKKQDAQLIRRTLITLLATEMKKHFNICLKAKPASLANLHQGGRPRIIR